MQIPIVDAHEIKENSAEINKRFDVLERLFNVNGELKEIRRVLERFASHLIIEQTTQVEHGKLLNVLDTIVRGDAEQKQLGDHRKMQIVWGFYRTFEHALMFLFGLGASELIHFFFK